MKICIIRNSEGPMNPQLLRVGTALSQTENDFFFVTRNRDETNQEGIVKKSLSIAGKQYDNYEIQLPQIIGGGLKNIVPLMKYGRILSAWLKENQDKYDAIHAVDYDTGSIAMKIAKQYNKKFIYHIADFYADSRLNIPNALKSMLRKNEYKVINTADATIICTEARKEQIEGSNPQRLVVVHNTPPIDQQDETINKLTEDDNITITYIGGMEKKRFIDQAINVVNKHTDFSLKLAGSLGDARDAVNNLTKDSNVDYIGKIPYNQALESLRQTDLMIAMYDPSHPNHKYSAANKIYEAMLMGKAIIVAKNTGMDKIVEAENMGYVIDFNSESFDALLNHISQNREELFEKSKNAYNAYESYSWEEMQDRIINLYNEI